MDAEVERCAERAAPRIFGPPELTGRADADTMKSAPNLLFYLAIPVSYVG